MIPESAVTRQDVPARRVLRMDQSRACRASAGTTGTGRSLSRSCPESGTGRAARLADDRPRGGCPHAQVPTSDLAADQHPNRPLTPPAALREATAHECSEDRGMATKRADPPRRTTILVVLGVSGSGKSTVAAMLAERLGLSFLETDDLHTPQDRARMAAGHPLADADRWPWLGRVTRWMDEQIASGASGVVACSALKRSYRDSAGRAAGGSAAVPAGEPGAHRVAAGRAAGPLLPGRAAGESVRGLRGAGGGRAPVRGAARGFPGADRRQGVGAARCRRAQNVTGQLKGARRARNRLKGRTRRAVPKAGSCLA